jgi:myo-inositol 2-dehydrogenase/D-chiro-inositol 1-dehydrogenase
MREENVDQAALVFGLAGYGAWGRFHAHAIADAPGAALGAIATPSAASAAAAGQDFPQAVVYRDWRALIDDPQLQAIAVATPNHLHAEIAIAALEAGKHVLVEKPMATTLADSDRVVRAALASRAVLSVGLECRLSPQWGRIKSLIEEGAIGRPRHVHVSLFRHPYRPGASGWRYDKPRVGSWILEEPVHFFDLVLWYLADAGRPVRISAIGAGEPGMEPVLSVMMRFPDGATAAINQILAGFSHIQTVEVVGSSGSIRATWQADTARSTTSAADLRVKRGDAQPQDIPIARSGEVFELEAQAAATVRAFRSGRPLVDAGAGRTAVALCLAAEASAQSGGHEVEAA